MTGVALKAGAVIDDAQVPYAEWQASGIVVVPYVPATHDPIVAAYQSQLSFPQAPPNLAVMVFTAGPPPGPPVTTDLQGRFVSPAAPFTGDALVWNGFEWIPRPIERFFAFAGGLIGDVIAARFGYLANAPSTGSSNDPIRYPFGQPTHARRLDVYVRRNTLISDTLVTIYRNGAPEAPAITIPGGAMGPFYVAADVAYALGEQIDVRIDNVAGGNFNDILLCAVVTLRAT